jgi:hypothetical protein
VADGPSGWTGAPVVLVLVLVLVAPASSFEAVDVDVVLAPPGADAEGDPDAWTVLGVARTSSLASLEEQAATASVAPRPRTSGRSRARRRAGALVVWTDISTSAVVGSLLARSAVY